MIYTLIEGVSICKQIIEVKHHGYKPTEWVAHDVQLTTHSPL